MVNMSAIRIAIRAACLLCSVGLATLPAREARLAKGFSAVKSPDGSQAPSATPPTDVSIVQADIDEEQRYQAAKTKAENEPAIQKLKFKADGALTLNEARVTLAAYNRALFRRIGQIDPAVKEHAELVQNAILRQMEE